MQGQTVGDTKCFAADLLRNRMFLNGSQDLKGVRDRFGSTHFARMRLLPCVDTLVFHFLVGSCESAAAVLTLIRLLAFRQLGGRGVRGGRRRRMRLAEFRVHRGVHR